MFLSRSVTRSKWDPRPPLTVGQIPADAVTADLRTKDNTLSFWRCRTDESSDLRQAALAIAAARERVERVEIVWLSDEEMESDGQRLEDTDGHTPVLDLRGTHVDVVGLDHVRLGRVAESVASALGNGQSLRLSRSEVLQLLIGAVRDGRVDAGRLQKRVRVEVSGAAGS